MSSFCYLLDSDHPRASSLGGRTYIGFTVNPLRRKKQHNGLLSNGAFKTRKWRPWEMVVLVTGFANQRTALQFEWTWQHGETSLDTREAMLRLKSMVQEAFAPAQKRTLKVNGVVGQILRLVAMLSTPPWKHFPLQVRVTSGPLWRLVGDALRMLLRFDGVELNNGDSFLLFPEHIGVSVGPLEDFLTQLGANEDQIECDKEEHENDVNGENAREDDRDDVGSDEYESRGNQVGVSSTATPVTPSPTKVGRKNMRIRCLICLQLAQRTWSECTCCGGRVHVGCLAAHYLRADSGRGASSVFSVTDLPRQPACLPDLGSCPHCLAESSWNDVLGRLKTAGWRKGGGGAETCAGGAEGGLEDAENASDVAHCRSTEPHLAKRHSYTPKLERTNAVPGTTPETTNAISPLEALVRRTDALRIDQEGDGIAESLASRCLRRLQEQEMKTLAADPVISNEVVIDLCSSSPSPSSKSGKSERVEFIDLSNGGCES